MGSKRAGYSRGIYQSNRTSKKRSCVQNALVNDSEKVLSKVSLFPVPPEQPPVYLTSSPVLQRQNKEKSTKMKIQLFPGDEATLNLFLKQGINPYLELTLKSSKSVTAVVNHLHTKWQNVSRDLESMRLFPYHLDSSSALKDGVWWGVKDEHITVEGLRKMQGCSDVLRLRYLWEIPLTALPKVSQKIDQIPVGAEEAVVLMPDVPESAPQAPDFCALVMGEDAEVPSEIIKSPLNLSPHEKNIFFPQETTVNDLNEILKPKSSDATAVFTDELNGWPQFGIQQVEDEEEKDKSPLADPQLSNLSWLENVFVNSVSQNEIFTQKNENVEPEEKEGKGEENYNFSTFNLKAFSRLHSHNEGEEHMEDGEAQIEVEQPAAFQENIVKSGSFDCCWEFSRRCFPVPETSQQLVNPSDSIPNADFLQEDITQQPLEKIQEIALPSLQENSRRVESLTHLCRNTSRESLGWLSQARKLEDDKSLQNLPIKLASGHTFEIRGPLGYEEEVGGPLEQGSLFQAEETKPLQWENSKDSLFDWNNLGLSSFEKGFGVGNDSNKQQAIASSEVEGEVNFSNIFHKSENEKRKTKADTPSYNSNGSSSSSSFLQCYELG